MAKTEIDEERYPWNGKNHAEQGYNQPNLTMEQVVVAERTNERLVTEVTNSGSVPQDNVLSTEITAGMEISASSENKQQVRKSQKTGKGTDR